VPGLGAGRLRMNDLYRVTVRQSAGEPTTLEIERASMVTLDDLGTLTIEAPGTIRTYSRGKWEGFTVTRIQEP